jgi:hypothetical protein
MHSDTQLGSSGMKILQKIIAILAFLIGAPTAFPQTPSARINDISIANYSGSLHSVPNATITVCTAAGSGLPCTPLATIYTNSSGTVTSPNPFQADANGNYGFWAPPGNYFVSLTGTVPTWQSITYTIPVQNYTNNTFSGTDVEASLNGILNAGACGSTNAPTWCSGSDIASWVNAAYSQCGNICTVYVPAGTYSTGNTINIPVVTNGTAALWIDNAATINYTGTGDAIYGSNAQVGRVRLKIFGGGQIVGTSSAANCIHFGAFSGARVDDITCRNFTNGNGFYNQGTNTVDFYSCHAVSNQTGLHNVGVVVSGNNYAPNAIHWHGGDMDFNGVGAAGAPIATGSGSAYFEDGALSNTVGNSENNVVEDTIFELNGTVSTANTSNAYIQSCYGCILRNNYFEYATPVGEAPVYGTIVGDSTNGSTTTAPGMISIIDNTYIEGTPYSKTIAASPTGAVENAGGTVATFTTTANHNLVSGVLVNITGVTNSAFNTASYAPCLVTVTGATTFTCPNITASANATSGSGSAALITSSIYDYSSDQTLVQGNVEINNPTYFLYQAAGATAAVNCNIAPSASANLGGYLNNVFNSCMTTTSTLPGMSYSTGYAMGFNTISGLNQDLIIQTRQAGTLNVKGQSAAGGNTWSVTDAGGITPGTTVIGSLPAAASSVGMIFVVSDSTSVASEGQTCAHSGAGVNAIAISNGSLWKCF